MLQNKKVLRNQAGMTLIEIMIVIAIIGGLMTFLGQTVFSNLGKAKTQQAKIQIQEITKSIQLYAVDCGSVPQSINALLEDDGNCSNWGPDPYVKANMIKDPWNNELVYEKNGSDFTLLSLGADGEDGGEGKDKDISSEDL